ncbi:unnamed protein product, partial [marine sediment metagenome]
NGKLPYVESFPHCEGFDHIKSEAGTKKDI